MFSHAHGRARAAARPASPQAVLIVYSIIAVPYRISFAPEVLGVWLVIDYTVDLNFFFDMVINFNTAYYDGEQHVAVVAPCKVRARWRRRSRPLAPPLPPMPARRRTSPCAPRAASSPRRALSGGGALPEDVVHHRLPIDRAL